MVNGLQRYSEIFGPTTRPHVPLGVRIGDVIYSGRIDGSEPGTGVFPQGPEAQMAQAFRNMRGMVEQAGASVDNIAHVMLYSRDNEHRDAINPPWTDMFPSPTDRPTYIQVALDSDLPGPMLFQMQVIAVAGARREVIEIPGIAHHNPIPMGVKIGNMVFSSRILPRTGEVNSDDPEEQARCAFQNMATLLELAGGSLRSAINVQTFMIDPAFKQFVDRCWEDAFGGFADPPNRQDTVLVLGGNGALKVMVKVIGVL